jgi:ankyrin repeat protein
MAEAAQLLVDRGADVTALDITHLTPLHVASLSGNPEAMKIF